jgi:hypothetical protein
MPDKNDRALLPVSVLALEFCEVGADSGVDPSWVENEAF